MTKKVNIILLIIFSLFTLVGILSTTSFSLQRESVAKDFSQCVYLQSSKTVFDETSNTITVTFKNVSNKDFEDVAIHLIYINQDGEIVGYSYSEQKTLTFEAKKEKTVTFNNPGWDYLIYNEILAAEQDVNNHSTWIRLKTGRNFKNPFEYDNIIKACLIAEISICLILDVLFIILLFINNYKAKQKSLINKIIK